MTRALTALALAILTGCASAPRAPEPGPDQNFTADHDFTAVHEVVQGDRVERDDAFAQALTGYRQDPQFHCSQPTYARYFAARYGASAAPSSAPKNCPPLVPFSVLLEHGDPEVVWVDVTRVQSIHLLFAGNSNQLASRFGHVAIRLVVCPEGVATSESCDPYLRDHLVLGYRANVDELSLDLWKALTGGYRAHLYAQPFMEVYQEYAIDEFREMYSLPLIMDGQRRQEMVRGLAELHWRFAGGYKFFTSNCGTLLQDALRVLWPAYAREPALDNNRLRPDRFFAALRSTPVSQSGLLSDLGAAERTGHYFASTHEYYERAAALVADAMAEPAFGDLDDFLRIMPAARRQLRESDRDFQQQLSTDTHLLEAQLMLEEYAVLRSEREITAAMGHYLLNHDMLARIDDLENKLPPDQWQVVNECLIKPIRNRGVPALTLQGIPSRESLATQSGDAVLCDSTEGQQSLRGISDLILDKESEAFQRIQALFDYYSASIDNVLALKER